MDWGLEKDLLIPFSEQDRRMQRGSTYLIFLYFDESTDRLVGTSRVSKQLEREEVELKQGDEVELLLGDVTDLGIKVIIDNKYDGLLYHGEIFKTLQLGERRTGYVKTVREDGKVDVSLERQGYQNVEPNVQKILDKLKQNGGFLPLHDKSTPDMIQLHLEMSKKTFKKAIGALYREKVIHLN
jgi:predicted RNA-binding protein (virulence factor B family)